LEEAPACPAPAGRPGEGHRLGALLRGQPELPRRFWGALTGKNPTDRAKKGSKRHLPVDGRGTPLACASPGPTATSRSKRWDSWTTSRPFAAGAAGRGGSPRRCTGTGSTARRGTSAA